MNTVLFVTGQEGVGKTTFISKHFGERERYFVLDLCEISDRLFGTMAAFWDDRLAKIYNQATEEAMDALMEDKILVVEFGLSGYDDEFVALVRAAKFNGFRVEINQITADGAFASGGFRRSGNAPNHLTFACVREHLLEILSGIVECMGYHQDWVRVCHFAGQGFTVDFFREEDEGGAKYFFLTNQTKYFLFDGSREEAEYAGVEVVHRYPTFADALKALQQLVPLAGLYPSHIQDGYLKTVKDAYQKFLFPNLEENGMDWVLFLN
jgi:hypothetical protein